jgi:peptidoglycan/xylan/chitin deacetylase (PgdA/CDA1 family)
VRPGSIILMHDGEGPHEGTIQALGPILKALKRKKLYPVTVSELLGLRQRYAKAD